MVDYLPTIDSLDLERLGAKTTIIGNFGTFHSKMSRSCKYLMGR